MLQDLLRVKAYVWVGQRNEHPLGAGAWLEVGGTSLPSQGPGKAWGVGLAPMRVRRAVPNSLTLTAFVDVRGDLHSCV